MAKSSSINIHKYPLPLSNDSMSRTKKPDKPLNDKILGMVIETLKDGWNANDLGIVSLSGNLIKKGKRELKKDKQFRGEFLDLIAKKFGL